jgi:hypothetical protein
MTTREEVLIHYEGVKEGIWKYAYWKDGVQYVGTTGTTLKEALAQLDEEKKKILRGTIE